MNPAKAGRARPAEPSFSATVIAWQKRHGRNALPWQNTRDAYRIWLSEIMLQQTQVAAVIPYYARFLERFPDVAALAAAPLPDVMELWSGLGYYSRARNLHRCAQLVMAHHGGCFPADPARLAELPGIGRSTAAAIAAFAFGTRAAILDGNVKRVFARAFGIEGNPSDKAVERELWRRAEALLPERDIEAYTQGLMDLGATVCTRGAPLCASCPLAAQCVARRDGRVAELPTPKERKTVPQRSTVMLAVLDRGQVLLEQRPPHGIWGGLLSLPEIDASEAGPARLEQEIAHALAAVGTVASCQALPAFSHGFTHFKLSVAPYAVRLARRNALAAQESWVWIELDRVAESALPAPVKKLLLEPALAALTRGRGEKPFK